MNRLNRLCLAPTETITFSAASCTPCTRESSSAAALRRSPVPETGVYLMTPLSSARTAACLMLSGVSKSGSPTPNAITSTPLALSAAARALTARVSDGWIFETRCAMRMLLTGSSGTSPPAPLHHGGYQAGHVTTKLRHFLDQRRRDVEVLLAGHEEHGLHTLPEPPVHVRELELVLEVGERAQSAHHGTGAA